MQSKGYETRRDGARGPALARWLAGLASAAFLPAVIGGIALGVVLFRAEDEGAARRLALAAQAAAQGADAEIESRRAILRAFGATLGSPIVLTDLPGLDAAARRVAAVAGAPIGILDRGLGLLVDTAQPFGTPLASTPAVAAGLWAVETGRPTVSDVLPGPGGSALPPLLLEPLLREGRAEALLSVALNPARLATAIGPGRAALLDGRGRPVAVSGGPATSLPDWPVLAAVPHGVTRNGVAPSGDAIRFAVSYVGAASDWRVVAWEEVAAAPTPMRGLLPWIAALLAMAVLIAALALRTTLRGLRGPVLAMRQHALATAAALDSDAIAPAAPVLRAPDELARLGAAIIAAQGAAQQRERRLRALAEAGALVLWRADAAGGWIEAAGWAGLTGQTTPAFRGDGWIEMLHPDDRAPSLAEWGRCLVARAQIGVEFRLRTNDEAASWRWVRATGVPVVTDEGQLLEWVGAIHDVTDARGAGAAHRFNESQVRQTVAELRAVYDNVPVGLALVDRSLRFLNVNARFAAISGLPAEAHVSRAPHEVMPEGLAGPLEAAQREVLESGRPVLDVTCTGQAPGSVQHLRHWLASCHPVRDAQGAVTGVSAVLQDVTERVRAERSRELLVTELNHRVKNTLATVQSIAAQCLRGPGSNSATFGRDFVGRLQALTRSHDLLAAQGWGQVDLARVVQQGLAPWLESGRAIRLAGSGRIQVNPAQAQALVLALHELATNAIKHGALSRSGGEVDVTWSLGDDAVVLFAWCESGGPVPMAPNAERRGFGVRLIERGLLHDLGPGAEVSLEFPEEGVRVQARFRVAASGMALLAAAN